MAFSRIPACRLPRCAGRQRIGRALTTSFEDRPRDLSLAAARPSSSRSAVNLSDTLPFDAAVRTATLPNGLTYFIRQNARPAKRVSLRLAVKAGSLFEADDQQGLAHLIEHMAFNGSAHFKPGELVSVLRIDRRATRPARERVHELRRDRLHARRADATSRRSSRRACTALADFAGGSPLDPGRSRQGARRRHRGVARRPWRQLAHPRQADPDALLPVAVRRAAADRQAGHHPQRARRAPARVLRHLVPARAHGVVVVGDIEPGAIEQAITADFRPADRARAGRADARPTPCRSPRNRSSASSPIPR